MSEEIQVFSKPFRKKILAAAAIGNMLEIYDFALYGYFAPIIATLFFPHSDKFLSLLATFGVFAMGFLMRPLGALVFGYFGDRVGRKKALSASIILMAVPTTLIGLLPTYAELGVWAGILLMICRLLQGLATGGEFTGSIIYMTEHAPKQRRGLYGSWAMVGTFLGFLIASAVSALCSSVLPVESLHRWGWRLPFLMGLLLGVVGLYLRLKMPETPSFLATKAGHKIVKNPLYTAFTQQFKTMMSIVGLNSLPATSYYLSFVYLSSYLVNYLHISLAMALTINTLNMVVLIVLTPIIGGLSDKIGRKPLLWLGVLGFLLFSYPLFLLMQQGNFTAILLAQLGFTLFVASLFAVMPATLVELTVVNVRYTVISFPYNLSSAVFGGVLPLVATFLIEKTSSALAPSMYLIGVAVVMAISLMRYHYGSYR